jgi:hypothetical protein
VKVSDDMNAISSVINESDSSVVVNLVHKIPTRIRNNDVDALGRYGKSGLDGLDKLIDSFTCMSRD